MKIDNNKRYLILNADDFGMCHSANVAIMKMLDDGVIKSTSIMPVCPWYEEAAQYLKNDPEKDAGVHLTFTSEWNYYRWGGLNYTDGYFPKDCETFEKNAVDNEVLNEIEAQINKVKESGISFSHIDNHMGSLYGIYTGKSYLPHIFKICSSLDMPFRFPKNFSKERKSTITKEQLDAFEQLKDLGLSMDVKLIDYLIEYPFHMLDGETYQSYTKMIIGTLRNLSSGVSELYIHPSIESEEIKAVNPSWEKRVMEYKIFYEDKVQNIIDEEGIELISWREFRNEQH